MGVFLAFIGMAVFATAVVCGPDAVDELLHRRRVRKLRREIEEEKEKEKEKANRGNDR